MACDEERPQCNNCTKSGRPCDGFPTRKRPEIHNPVSKQPDEDCNSVIATLDSPTRPEKSPTDENENQPISLSYTSPEDFSSQAINTSSPISLLSNDCLEIFQELGGASSNPQLDFDLDTVQGTIEDARARFRAWGTNIAAFRNGKLRTSLDFRLSEAPGIRNTILQVLKDLKEYLAECESVHKLRKSQS